MVDIVERLREAHPFSHQYLLGSMILADAADEIESLRQQLAESQARVRQLEAQLEGKK